MITVPSWLPVGELATALVILGSLVLVRWLDRERDWGALRRSRLLLGIPWGTLISITGVLCVYLFLQGGWSAWYRPVTVAFRSWSYFYPTGMLLAPFSHNGPGHLTGNLVGAIVLGSLAEYAWGHFPEDRGTSSFGSWRSNPYVRAFVVFPAGVFVVGLGTVLLGWGPIIGFSGVVFAFAGFAVLRYPIATIVALEARRVVEVAYFSVLDPVVVTQAQPQFVRPWWAGIAVQGHVLGLLLGMLAAVVIGRRRAVDPTRLWIGVVLLATSLTVWAVWWYRGGAEYVLYRGIGVILVFVLAMLVTVSARAMRSRRTVYDVPLHVVGVLLVVFPVLVMGFVAVPYNLSTVGDAAVPGDATVVSVQDYSVFYAENVTDQHVSVVNLSAFGETTDVRRSGVIVVSQERHTWHRAVSTAELAFAGRRDVRVGGLGWRESIGVRREGWVAENNQTAYVVRVQPPESEWRVAFRSDPAIAGPRIAGYRVRIDPRRDGFYLVARTNESLIGEAPIPPPDSSVDVGRLSFLHVNESVYAIHEDTRVRIARKETYENV